MGNKPENENMMNIDVLIGLHAGVLNLGCQVKHNEMKPMITIIVTNIFFIC